MRTFKWQTIAFKSLVTLFRTRFKFATRFKKEETPATMYALLHTAYYNQHAHEIVLR